MILHLTWIFLGSEERNNTNAEAFEKLKHVASLSSPVNAIASPGMSVDSLDTILKKVHSARDKHIFRCEFQLDNFFLPENLLNSFCYISACFNIISNTFVVRKISSVGRFT